MASEIEIKFQVPATERERLRRALATASASTVALRASTVALRASYYDTADDRLAAAGLALRLRREGRRRVQTLKGRGQGLIDRFEHEVELPPGPFALDLARHAGTPAGETLAALLADGAPLVERYRTEVKRLLRRVRTAGATVEIAFDEGRIVAGTRRLALCELEFELVVGAPAALVALAARWAERHRLWPDLVPKSERGRRLARDITRVAPLKAEPAAWPPDATPAAALAAMLQSALTQVLANASEIGGGRGAPEHLHQLRVGIRRLRSALRLFGRWGSDPSAARALEAEWRAPFALLGRARDADVLAALPGLPLQLPAPAEEAVDAGAVVRGPEFTALALRTLERALAALPALESTLAEAAPPVLRKAWKRVVAGVAGFATATPPERHALRKRLKRARYATEFLLPMLPEKPARDALAAMRTALDALGEYNDVIVAEAYCRTLGEDDPKVAYALGWLAATRDILLARAAARLARLAEVKRFWS